MRDFMLDYVNLLLDAINKYNEDDVDSKNRLRDLVCIISENDSVKSDPLIKEFRRHQSNGLSDSRIFCGLKSVLG